MPQESPTLKEQLAILVPDARVRRKGAGRDPRPGRRAGSGAAKAPAGRAALPRAAGFWLVAGALFLLLFASAAASPLYAVYQAQWRFSALIDLQPDRSGRAPVVTSAGALLGLGVGGLGTSALFQYASAPTQLVWWLLLGASAAAAVAVLAIPETTPGQAVVLAALRPRVAVSTFRFSEG
jgi:hypothetical protein